MEREIRPVSSRYGWWITSTAWAEATIDHTDCKRERHTCRHEAQERRTVMSGLPPKGVLRTVVA